MNSPFFTTARTILGNDVPNLQGGMSYSAMVYQGTRSNDEILGSYEADSIFGDDGSDTIDGSGGNDYIHGQQGEDLLGGNMGDDTIRGGKGMDGILGGMGNDELFGDRDLDAIAGQEGNDTIHGGKGNDILGGNEGDDVIFGDLGDDILLGGAGVDYFSFAPHFGEDIIVDFASSYYWSGGDKIVLSSAITPSVNDIMSRISYAGLDDSFPNDAIIDFGKHGKIYLLDVGYSGLHENDFIIV